MSTVILELKDHIARITLHRPDSGNKIDGILAAELHDACRQIGQDRDIYAVVITGAGTVFCSGSEDLHHVYGIADAVAGIEQPVIAAVNGDALGQGLELALSCDIRIAADRAHFSMDQVAHGCLPIDGGTQRLSRIAGRSKAMELILTADILDAHSALEAGLVHTIASPDNLPDGVNKMAQTMAARAPAAMRYAKEAVMKGLDMTLEQGLRLEADLYFLLHTTTDRTEGITAFQQKRTPKFKGE